ncbi:hypothetical protein DRW07_05290 [Alteromonas sediminis]|uniref:Uncharacterized protein n=1 Tax=Alteromonas sediminis TaxID=2259342 RepID=A0A3N5Y7X7_9ALTE|nr:DUF6387 family protein [Alteromonas sediminis]RPJ66959.1 hypothetical protein DRW07_05290 [Alteromonas sediminis]
MNKRYSRNTPDTPSWFDENNYNWVDEISARELAKQLTARWEIRYYEQHEYPETLGNEFKERANRNYLQIICGRPRIEFSEKESVCPAHTSVAPITQDEVLELSKEIEMIRSGLLDTDADDPSLDLAIGTAIIKVNLNIDRHQIKDDFEKFLDNTKKLYDEHFYGKIEQAKRSIDIEKENFIKYKVLQLLDIENYRLVNKLAPLTPTKLMELDFFTEGLKNHPSPSTLKDTLKNALNSHYRYRLFNQYKN